MFDEPENDQPPEERLTNPTDLAQEKLNEFRMHSQLAATFEGARKFDAQLIPGFDPALARDIQQKIARLAKSKPANSPVLPKSSSDQAAELLNLPQNSTEVKEISTNDYHIHRRPGEVIVLRWLEGDQVDSFYDRLQAHFDAALAGFIEDERSASAWKSDDKQKELLDALEKVKIEMADIYLRNVIKKDAVFVLSTQMADEMDIIYLADTLMNTTPAELVGPRSAPPDDPTDQDRAWFFNLFSLRGIVGGVEKMLFFTFLQKTEDTFAVD